MTTRIHGPCALTPEGGLAVFLINRTGAPTIRGTLVASSTAHDGAFMVNGAGGEQPIGVVHESGIADGSSCLVVIAGIAYMLLQNATAATHGNWVRASAAVAGRVDATAAVPPGGGIPELTAHMSEVGHCLESVGAGVDQLCKILTHFN